MVCNLYYPRVSIMGNYNIKDLYVVKLNFKNLVKDFKNVVIDFKNFVMEAYDTIDRGVNCTFKCLDFDILLDL